MMQPYQINAEHELQQEGSFPKKKRFLPDEVLEKLYQQKLRAGYNKRNKKCEQCFEYKSVTGQCNCNI